MGKCGLRQTPEFYISGQLMGFYKMSSIDDKNRSTKHKDTTVTKSLFYIDKIKSDISRQGTDRPEPSVRYI